MVSWGSIVSCDFTSGEKDLTLEGINRLKFYLGRIKCKMNKC